MSTKDPADPADPLSATGIFLNAFRTQPDPVEEPARETAAPPGEFTQMFAAVQGSAPPKPEPPPPPPPPAQEATRIFVRQATPPPPVPPQRMKGFSAPGASDFASDDGSFSQFFRKIPSPQAAPAPPAAAPQASADAGSVTSWMRKLSAEDEPVASTQIFEAAPTAPSGPGEFTRIMSGDALRTTPEKPKAQPPVVEPPKAAAPVLAPPQSKLQQMLPILLVLNGFLLLVLIVLVVFVLLRK